MFSLALLFGYSLLAEALTDYKISPQDVLIVDVYNEKDLSKEVRVSAKGEITLPLLNNVKVEGMTPAEVETRLKELYGKDYLVDPQIIVAVKDYRQRKVSVFGQVNQPKLVDLPAEQKMTVIEAIAAAGGFTKIAKHIQVTRAWGEKPFKFKQDELKKNSDPQKAFTLEPGDIIFVTESFF